MNPFGACEHHSGSFSNDCSSINSESIVLIFSGESNVRYGCSG
jgi:hypothetical protein